MINACGDASVERCVARYYHKIIEFLLDDMVFECDEYDLNGVILEV
jgi:ATP-dependent protease HslVU (ClpYQ) ATPase subunit